MYLILQLEYNYRSTTNILKSSAIISDFTDSIISINCCFKSISKSHFCSSNNHRTRNTSQTDHQIIKEQRSGYKDQNFNFLMRTVYKCSITYGTEFPYNVLIAYQFHAMSDMMIRSLEFAQLMCWLVTGRNWTAQLRANVSGGCIYCAIKPLLPHSHPQINWVSLVSYFFTLMFKDTRAFIHNLSTT